MFFEGSVYVFLTTDGGLSWSEAQKLVASDGVTLDWFGGRVCVSDDVLVVGTIGDDDKGSNTGTHRMYCMLLRLANLILLGTYDL